MFPKRLSILGVGLLGGSIGLAVRSVLKDCHITGYGHRQSTLDQALSLGAIDTATLDPLAAVRDADLIILCTPVGLFHDLLRQIGQALTPGAILTDVGSTKLSVVQAAESLLPPNVHFVGSHPMAGSEKRGVEFARADLFQNSVCILTPTPHTHSPSLSQVDSFWKLLGMRTTQVPPDEHDRLLADISHLPHLAAAALISMQNPAALDLCGKGFLDATRIASGDGALWRDILLDNRQNIRASVERLQSHLTQILTLLDQNNGDTLRQWLDQASSTRHSLLHRKHPNANSE